ncbi:hypothetical protein BX600DRAFT_506011 [Xylariales sp. PMI_506]|nr:hypothetical protein BX600DRAFT_506011 [Xylariales sp. PMI_506]
MGMQCDDGTYFGLLALLALLCLLDALPSDDPEQDRRTPIQGPDRLHTVPVCTFPHSLRKRGPGSEPIIAGPTGWAAKLVRPSPEGPKCEELPVNNRAPFITGLNVHANARATSPELDAHPPAAADEQNRHCR